MGCSPEPPVASKPFEVCLFLSCSLSNGNVLGKSSMETLAQTEEENLLLKAGPGNGGGSGKPAWERGTGQIERRLMWDSFLYAEYHW